MTTLVRFREPLGNSSMNAEFERLINTVLAAPSPLRPGMGTSARRLGDRG